SRIAAIFLSSDLTGSLVGEVAWVVSFSSCARMERAWRMALELAVIKAARRVWSLYMASSSAGEVLTRGSIFRANGVEVIEAPFAARRALYSPGSARGPCGTRGVSPGTAEIGNSWRTETGAG